MKKGTSRGPAASGKKEEREKKELLHKIKEALSPAKKGGKTAYWLAKETGISYNSIHGYLHNTQEPTLSNLKKIAEVLGISGKDLINF
jgi:transcriptional regulator with XRE-family HTH domain